MCYDAIKEFNKLRHTRLKKVEFIPPDMLKIFIIGYDDIISNGSQENLLCVTFQNVCSFRHSDEGYRLVFLYSYPYEVCVHSAPVLITQDPDYINSFMSLNKNYYSVNADIQLNHYIIFTLNDIIDIISPSNPLLEVL